MKLSATMQAALASIQAANGTIVRKRGGHWVY